MKHGTEDEELPYGGGDARCTRLLHAQRRAWERYRVRLNLVDLQLLEYRAQLAADKLPNAHAVVMARDRDGVTVESVYRGKTMRFVYLLTERTLVTFLPRDIAAEIAAYRIVGDKRRDANKMYKPAYHRGKKRRGR